MDRNTHRWLAEQRAQIRHSAGCDDDTGPNARAAQFTDGDSFILARRYANVEPARPVCDERKFVRCRIADASQHERVFLFACRVRPLQASA